MRVTILAGYFAPENSADSRLNEDLARSIAEYGAEVCVIVPVPSRGVKYQETRKYKKLRRERIGERIEVLRVGAAKGYSKGLLTRGFNYLWNVFHMYIAARKINTDVYFIISTPPFLGYVAAILSMKRPVIFKLQDVFPDSLVIAKNFDEKNILIRFLRRIEKAIYSRITHVQVVSRDVLHTLLSRGVPQEKINVVHDWVDTKKCYPIERRDNVLFERYRLDKEKFYVCYAGNIGHLQNIQSLVEAIELVHRQRPVELVIIGEGALQKKLFEWVGQGERSTFIHLLPWQPPEDMSHVYSLGDIGFVSLRAGVSKIAFPSKTWMIMAAARPVLCEVEEESELADILRQFGCGKYVQPANVGDIADAIISMYDNKHELDTMGKNGQQYVLEHIDKQVSLSKHYEIIKRAYENEYGH